MTNTSTEQPKLVLRQAVAKFNDKGRRSANPWYVSTKPKGIRKANPDDPGEVFTFRTEQEAWDYAAEINYQLRNGGAIGVGAAKTFGHAAQIMIEKNQRLRDGGYKVPTYMNDYITNAEQWCDKLIGNVRLGDIKCIDITKEDIENHLNSWTKDKMRKKKVVGQEPISASGKKHKRGTAKRIMKIAIDRGWSYKDVTKEIVILEQKYADINGNKPKQVDKALQFSMKELRYLFEAALSLDRPKFKKDGEMYEPAHCDGVAVLFAGTLGTRGGELEGMAWEQIDWELGRVHIDRAQRAGIHKGSQVVGIPKETKNGRKIHRNRHVPIQPKTLSALREWYMRTPFKQPTDRIFPTRSGEPQYDTKAWNKFIRRVLILARKNAKAVEGDQFEFRKQNFTFKALRHLYASILVSQHGNDFVKIADRMGHQDVRTTRDHYAEWIDDPAGDKEEAEQADAKLWGSK